MPSIQTLRTCPEGHQYYKSRSCEICPVCEKQTEASELFLSKLGAPARRSLQENGISLSQLSLYTEKEILSLHGIGPSSIPKLRQALQAINLTFKHKM